MYHNFIHSSVDGHLGCFHVLAVVNSTAMNNEIHVSFSILVPSGYMPRSGISGSYSSFVPRFLRNLHTREHARGGGREGERKQVMIVKPVLLLLRLRNVGRI